MCGRSTCRRPGQQTRRPRGQDGARSLAGTSPSALFRFSLRRRPTLEQVTTLSVVIPATDGPTTLGLVSAAIDCAADPPEEVIIIESPQDLVPAAARNLGARSAQNDVIVFVDADVEV